jgi:hypothetical protein
VGLFTATAVTGVSLTENVLVNETFEIIVMW